MKPLIFTLLLLNLGCSTFTKRELLTKEDYRYSEASFQRSDVDGALKSFPDKEAGGFITSVEKAWLYLLAGNPKPDLLLPLAAQLEKRTTLRISKEAQSFFYKETDDGYYPAEHEAIILHLILASSFARLSDIEKTKVSLRKAGLYLETEYGNFRPFDDPGLRMWLAALWLHVGDWNQARADILRASRLTGRKDLKILAEAKDPPQTFAVIFRGPGPRPKGTLSMARKNLSFEVLVNSRALGLKSDDLKVLKVPFQFPTAYWYERHQERDHAIREVLDQSRYMVEASGYGAASGVTYLSGSLAATAVIVAGVAVGAAIVVGGAYLAILTESAEIGGLVVVLGAALGTAIVGKGVDIYKNAEKTSASILRKGLDRSGGYRFVRFLPDYIHMYSDQKAHQQLYLISQEKSNLSPFLSLETSAQKTKVLFFHDPTSRQLKTLSYDHGAWSKKKSLYEWAKSEVKLTFEQAKSFCGDLKKASGRNWQMGSWEAVHLDKMQGLRDWIGPRELWSAPPRQNQTACQIIHYEDGGLSPFVDCQRTAHAICMLKKQT